MGVSGKIDGDLSHYTKSRGEVSLVEQDTIENVSAAYLKFIINLVFSEKN